MFATTAVNGNSLIKKLCRVTVVKDLLWKWKSQSMVEGQHSKNPATNWVVGKGEMKEEEDSIYFFCSCCHCPFHFHNPE